MWFVKKELEKEEEKEEEEEEEETVVLPFENHPSHQARPLRNESSYRHNSVRRGHHPSTRTTPLRIVIFYIQHDSFD